MATPLAAPARARLAPGRPMPARAASTAATVRGPLPDSVLAVVGSRREITVSRFRKAWDQVAPPARPDSLTPEGARGFLELLVSKEALGEAAGRERWIWTARESAEYQGQRDRLVIQTMLDSALTATRRGLGPRGDSLDQQALGIVARDSAMTRLHVRYEEALLAKLAQAWGAIPRPSRDSSMFAQLRAMGAMPAVDPADTAKVVARSDEGDYRVAGLLEAWRRLNPLYRPRIESGSQVRDLVKNGLFERMLRRDAERRGLEHRADIAAALANLREYNDVSHLVAREVYARIATDSLTLLKHFRARQDDWTLPLRVKVLGIVLGDRGEASALAVRLRAAGEAESLEAVSRRGGASLAYEVSAASDSALFARAMRAGTGAVLGPDPVEDGWEVWRVVAVMPGRRRSFDEVRDLVHHSWYGEEGERLMRALVDSLRAATPVAINQAALAKLGGARGN
ncbi:MAG: peptidyl-prolyl cis-trans isomerase [Candidatus Eisenbacteria bacterium]|nr:peptidyl-prolyl cis-trans isomerase [Candidatus Eisenbacteria bacterium]